MEGGGVEGRRCLRVFCALGIWECGFERGHVVLRGGKGEVCVYRNHKNRLGGR